ncbi:hypothetical protein ABK040_008537 [Willaertia magna]
MNSNYSTDTDKGLYKKVWLNKEEVKIGINQLPYSFPENKVTILVVNKQEEEISKTRSIIKFNVTFHKEFNFLMNNDGHCVDELFCFKELFFKEITFQNANYFIIFAARGKWFTKDILQQDLIGKPLLKVFIRIMNNLFNYNLSQNVNKEDQSVAFIYDNNEKKCYEPIESKGLMKLEYIWSPDKIICDHYEEGLMIGFASQSKFNVNGQNYTTGFGWYLNGSGYKYPGDSISISSNIYFGSKTIIEVKYDFKKETISYNVNGQNYEDVFTNVKDTGIRFLEKREFTNREEEIKREYKKRTEELQQKEEELQKEIQEIDKIKQKMSTTTLLSTNKPIKLNVGGTVFTTLLNTLTSEPDTFFVTFFSDYFAKEMTDVCYFIDRDPKYFNLILNHLRGNDIVKKIESLNDNDLLNFVEEVHYYQIESLMKKLPKKGIIILKQMGVELLDKIL